jgi:hypothetical protein
MTWLAETKGEIRPNTSLKSQAANAWCEKMSRTSYGEWRYLFIPQKNLEAALASGIKSVSNLADRLKKEAGTRDPPPLKWSDLRYVFDIQEDCNGKEAIQA